MASIVSADSPVHTHAMLTDSALALRMTGVCKAFPGVVALKGVDLEVRHREVHVLLGENGAG